MQKTEESPLVTVAMVSYNSERYIRMAIESVLASSYTNFELLICDDCSSDSTWNIIKEYNDHRIAAYKNEKNLKEYGNRNKCVNIAKGEYIIFVDADDYLFPDSIEKCIKYYKAFPDAAFILAANTRQSMLYPVLLEASYSLKIHFFIEPLFNHSLLQAFFSTKALKENKFSTNFISGDYYCFLKLASQNNFLLINAPLGWWRNHSDQASKKLIGANAIKDRIGILTNLFPIINTLTQKEKNAIINMHIKKLLRFIIKNPLSIPLNLLKILFNYKHSSINIKITFDSLGITVPLTKDIAKNPYSIENKRK